ncbi:zinc metalloprotease [Sphingobacterium griseoflavum]|uniref:Peptidase M50 n=1 Tax=Sphingobacterium griseoflavum TaxID=1474952 RepID=A0ABQ3HS52_9SPHI|nr:hypothetical protein [Sphingobacterium griseoflavum]GHE28778.1 hypothetical protein GCM10017764_09170 [Sphingobacterium griseoflavum]
MNLSLNTEYLLIGDIDRQEVVVLKHKRTHRVFRMSSMEYRIIELYAKGCSKQKIIETFEADYEISMEVLDAIINSATTHSFVVARGGYEQFPKYKIQRNFISLLNYGIFLALKRLKLNPNRIKLDSGGSFNLTKIIKWTPRPVPAPLYRAGSLALLGLLLFTLLFFVLFRAQSLDFALVFYNLSHIGFLTMLLIAFPISLVISFFHELAHYIVYKRNGGTQHELGLGLLYGFIPIFYTATEDMVIWHNKWTKIKVALAGLASDLFFLCLGLSLYALISSPWIAGICSFIFLNLVVKIIYNCNPFSPGSDMYFVFLDLFNLDISFTNAHEQVKAIRKNKHTKIHWGSLAYALACYLSITVYLLSFLLILSFPIWINFFI